MNRSIRIGRSDRTLLAAAVALSTESLKSPSPESRISDSTAWSNTRASPYSARTPLVWRAHVGTTRGVAEASPWTVGARRMSSMARSEAMSSTTSVSARAMMSCPWESSSSTRRTGTTGCHAFGNTTTVSDRWPSETRRRPIPFPVGEACSHRLSTTSDARSRIPMLDPHWRVPLEPDPSALRHRRR